VNVPFGSILVAALILLARPAVAQCPDGSAPPCAPPPERHAAPPSRALDPNLIAVLPFRVTGANPALAYLHEGMVELLGAILTGDGGPRAVDPGYVLRAWTRSGGTPRRGLDPPTAVRMVRELGAGRALLGGVIGSPSRVTLTASVYDVASGTPRSATVSAEGPADSMAALVDRLVGQLLADELREGEARRSTLAGTPLPALRAYVAGMAAYRRASWAEASQQLTRAVTLDTSFVLAAMALIRVSAYVGAGPDVIARAKALIWSTRERLGVRDRAVLTRQLGPRYPEPSSFVEYLAAANRVLELGPEYAEAWFHLGDLYFHYGTYVGIPDALQRAEAAFWQAVSLDAGYMPAVEHLLQLAASRRDTAAVRRLRARFTPASGELAGNQWLVAVTLHDAAGLRRFATRLNSAPSVLVFRTIVGFAQLLGIGRGEAERALARREWGAVLQAERREEVEARYWAALNFGHPQVAAALLEDWARVESRSVVDGIAVATALHGDGDTAAAAAAVGRLTPVASAPPGARCVVEQWKVLHGDTTTVSAALEMLARSTEADVMVCASVLEALRAPSAPLKLDSLMRTGPYGDFRKYPNLALARLWAARGDTSRALAASRRRWLFLTLTSVPFLSTYLREECRLAAAIGDQEDGPPACRHYLFLRSDPDPALVPQRDSVRSELARLEGR
jgi:tetratricopeptide (TPR) repeat protein